MKFITVIFVALASAGVACAQPIGASYEKSLFSPGLFGGKWAETTQSDVAITQRTSSQLVYKGDLVALFDKFSATVASELPSEDFNINLVTNKVDGDFTPGKTWMSSFTVPARKGSRCAASVVFDFNSVSAGEKTVMVLVNGTQSEMRVVTVMSDGKWTLPAECNNASGKGTGTITFVPDSGLIISAESIGYFGSTQISGSRLNLKELKK